jgi:hypothetical protein
MTLARLEGRILDHDVAWDHWFEVTTFGSFAP